MNILLIINVITYFSTYLPVLIGIFIFKKIKKNYRLLFYFTIYVAVQESIRWLLDVNYVDKVVLNFYGIIETLLLGYMYKLLINSTKWKKVIPVILVLLVLYFIFNMVFIEGLSALNSISLTLESILFLVLSSRLFFQFIETNPSKPLLKYEDFWFNLGVFVYFALNFFIFMMGDELYSKVEAELIVFKLWDIHDFLNLFLNFSFAMVLWFSSRNQVQVEQTKGLGISN